MALPKLISIESGIWLKNANRPKIGPQQCKYSIKIVVPEPLVFSIGERPLHLILAVKRVSKRWICRCRSYPYFCRASVCESNIFVEPELCVPPFLSSRVRAYHYFCRAGFVRTTILVEPDSCVPLFLSSRIRAYHYFCRARFLRTTIFVERELRLLAFLQCFCNPLAVWHWQPGFGSSWGGPQPEPKIDFFDINLN